MANNGELEMIRSEVEKSTSRSSHYASIPETIRAEVAKYALVHGTSAALTKFSNKYPKLTFRRTTINSWKRMAKANKDGPIFRKKGRPNLLSETLLLKTKDVIVGSRLAGTVISRRMVIAIGTGVVKANDPGKKFVPL